MNLTGVGMAGLVGGPLSGAAAAGQPALPAMPANATPQRMTVKGATNTLVLDNILLGDVWVLGGQSNMEHPISRVEGGQLEILSANLPKLRHLSVPQPNGPDVLENFPRMMEWHGFFNTHYRRGYWDVCSPGTVPELSAIGYIFARRIQQVTGVPVGVIDISRGGTCLETWIPIDAFKRIGAKGRVAVYVGKLPSPRP